MDLQKLRDIPITTYLQVTDDPDDVIEVRYRIGTLGSAFDDWFFDPQAGGAATIYEVAARACTYIGVTVDGETVPCTVEGLQVVPDQILWAIVRQVRGEANVGKLGASRSRPILRLAEKSGTAPTGTSS